MSREPASLLHELDCWQALLDDLRALNSGILAAAEQLARIPIELLPLAFLPGCERERERVASLAGKAAAHVSELQAPLDSLLELVTGRLLALQAEHAGDDSEAER